MHTDSTFQNLLEHYIFTVADSFIEQASSHEQQRLMNLLKDIGKPVNQQKPTEISCWENQNRE